MREDKLNFGILIRIFVSLLPILFGMPTVAAITCSYTVAMTFLTGGIVSTIACSLTGIAAAMFLSSSSYGEGGTLMGLMIGVQAVLCAGGGIIGLFKKKDFYKALFLATIGVLIPELIYLNSTAHAEGMSLAEMLVPTVAELKEIIGSTFKSMPSDAQNLLLQQGLSVDAVSELVRNFTVMVIPSALILVSMITAYIVMWAVTAHIRKYPNEKIHSFSKIKLSPICSILAVVFTAALLFGAGQINSIVSVVLVNMLIILIAMAFFSGISLVDFYFRKALPFKIIRIIIHVVTVTNFSLVYILAAFVDSFANFRKLPKQSDIKGGGDFETKE